IYTDWQSGIDPNKISFAPSFNADHVNGNAVSGSVQVLNGVPAEMAVLVNDTNFADAAWSPYNSNFIAALPSVDGPYDVWIGLRGRAGAASMQTWQASTIWRDTTAPVLV